MKACTKCGCKKPASSFYRNRSARDGLTFHCVDCLTAYRAKYRSDPDKLAWENANKRDWYHLNKNKARA